MSCIGFLNEWNNKFCESRYLASGVLNAESREPRVKLNNTFIYAKRPFYSLRQKCCDTKSFPLAPLFNVALWCYFWVHLDCTPIFTNIEERKRRDLMNG